MLTETEVQYHCYESLLTDSVLNQSNPIHTA